MNTLSLVQVKPLTNPDTNIVKVTVSGAYVNGVGDTLPLNTIADPGMIGQVPMPNPGQNPPPVTPCLLNQDTPGYQAYVHRSVAAGIGGAAAITTFFLRWWNYTVSPAVELASGAYPAAITGGETFLEIDVPIYQNT
jgi:hypothetical protein